VHVRFETSSLAPIRFVEQKCECLEEEQHYYQTQAPAAANAAFMTVYGGTFEILGCYTAHCVEQLIAFCR